MDLVSDVTLRVREEDLVSAIWYSDGSGASGILGAGLSSLPEDWKIVSIWHDKECGLVELKLQRKELES